MAKEAAPPEMSFWEAIADSITGSRRVTPETMALPEYTGMPELNRFSLPSFRSALGTVITSPEETVEVLLSNFPELRVRQDSKGNYILRSSINNREYAIPPGFSVGDIPRALAGLASVVPAGLATTIPRAAAVAAGNQAAFEALQALTGGSFDPDDVAIAGTIGAAFPALGAGAKAAIGAARKVLRRSTPQQSFQAGGVTRASNAIAASKGAGKGAADPLLLRTLAAEANRTPFTAKYNKGMADPSQAFTDVERMAKEYGYEGLMNPQQGTAILYRPTPVQPFAKGGAVKPIKEGLKRGIKGALEMAEPMVNRISMSFKDVTKRVPELTEAAQAVSRGDMSADEYDRLVRRYKPVTPYEFVPEPASADDAMRALTENKRPMFGKASEMSPGERADLRLDIPAYKDHGVWVNSIHRKDAPTVYGSVSSVKNATMIGSPEKAMKVATGETPKAPFAVIRGDWNPMTESEAVKAAKQYLNHPEWRQVGYDPERHGYFYDRATMEPILGAEEVIQIGPLVLARKPQFGKKSEQKYQSGGLARMSRRK